jgi:dTDP-4-dehydrorhamnose reductase
MRKTVIVTGVSSSPGFKIALKLAETGWDVLGVYNQHPVEKIFAVKWDLDKDPQNLLRTYMPSLLVHVAAIGDVDKCEAEPLSCYKINTVATRELVKGSYKLGVRMIYLSTDYVFDGFKGMYGEEDPPRPINYYGLTKLLGEEAVLSIEGTVIRTSWIYGFGPGRQNFGKTVVEKLSRGEIIRAIIDQWGSPTLNTLIGEAVKVLAEKELSGILHVAGPRMSRFEFALSIAEFFGFPKDLIKPISVSEIGYKAPRPKDSSLDNRRAIDLLKIPLNDIKYSLTIFRKEWEETKYASDRS